MMIMYCADPLEDNALLLSPLIFFRHKIKKKWFQSRIDNHYENET